MTSATIIQRAASDGVMLALTLTGMIRVTGNAAAVKRWRNILVEHKPGIVAALHAANDSLPAKATPGQAAELRTLIEYVLADAPGEWNEVHRIACDDPEAALESLKTLADQAQERAIWGPKCKRREVVSD